MPAWNILPAFVLDQLLPALALNVLSGDQRAIYNLFTAQHYGFSTGVGVGNALLGEHNTPLVPRCTGLIAYEGTFGAGGAWVADYAVGLTVGNLPGDTVGRGRITFQFYSGLITTMADTLYSVFFSEAATSVAFPTRVKWFNRLVGSCDFSWVYDDGTGNWIETSTDEDAFMVSIHGNASPPAVTQIGIITGPGTYNISGTILIFRDRVTNLPVYFWVANGARQWGSVDPNPAAPHTLLDPLALIDQNPAAPGTQYFWFNNFPQPGAGNGLLSSASSPDATPVPIQFVAMSDTTTGSIWYLACDTAAGAGPLALVLSNVHP